MKDYLFSLASYFFAICAIWCFAVALIMLISSVLSEQPNTAEPGSQTSALTAEYWLPCEAPRPDVACWRSGQAVVCLPKEKKP
jgi:hypothetical protein